MGRLFAGNAVPDLGKALTVFELGELKGRGDVQGVVLMLVVFLATQRMYHGPRTRVKAIVIDEAWDLLSGEDSRTFLEGAARRARKYRGALVTGTQSGQRLLRQPRRARRLGKLGLGDFPRPEGRVGRAAQAGEAHPLRPRHGARAQEPHHRRRAAMPSWCCTARTAGGSPASCSMPGRWRCSRRAARPSPRSRTSRPQGLTTRRGHRPARGGRFSHGDDAPHAAGDARRAGAATEDIPKHPKREEITE